VRYYVLIELGLGHRVELDELLGAKAMTHLGVAMQPLKCVIDLYLNIFPYDSGLNLLLGGHMNLLLETRDPQQQ